MPSAGVTSPPMERFAAAASTTFNTTQKVMLNRPEGGAAPRRRLRSHRVAVVSKQACQHWLFSIFAA
jgi:hypothetical protein